MVNQDLVTYVKSQRSQGLPDSTIAQNLRDNHWPEESITEVLSTKETSYYSVGQLFDHSFSLFKQKFLKLALVLLAPGVVAFLITILFALGYAAYNSMVTQSSLDGGNPVLVAIVGLLVFIALALATIIVEFWGASAAVITVSSETPIGFTEAFKRGWKFVRSYWWVSALFVITIGGSSVFFLIPGIIYLVWFNFAPYVLINENQKGMSALIMSREYVRGRWWSVFFRLILAFVVLFFIYFIPNIFLAILGLNKSLIEALVNFVLNFGIGIFGLCFTYTMYRNLHDSKGPVNIEVTGKLKFAYLILGILGLVLALIGMPIAMVATINPGRQIQKANDARSKSDMMQLEFALKMYYSEKGEYPTNLDQLVPTYVKKLSEPTDKSYCYQVTVNDENDIEVKMIKSSSVMDCNEVVSKLR